MSCGVAVLVYLHCCSLLYWRNRNCSSANKPEKIWVLNKLTVTFVTVFCCSKCALPSLSSLRYNSLHLHLGVARKSSSRNLLWVSHIENVSGFTEDVSRAMETPTFPYCSWLEIVIYLSLGISWFHFVLEQKPSFFLIAPGCLLPWNIDAGLRRHWLA